MRFVSALSFCALVLMSSPTLADSRIFVIANQSDGYGVNECLANGEKCGEHAARAYCRSRDFTQATNYHRVAPDEVTNSVPVSTGRTCSAGECGEYIAITCQR
ncbi:hypothetical protein V1291_000866 [Nitrobacteraceae bacterium AZCC 1564]